MRIEVVEHEGVEEVRLEGIVRKIDTYWRHDHF